MDSNRQRVKKKGKKTFGQYDNYRKTEKFRMSNKGADGW